MYKRIRDLREDKDLSQKEIASILNMSQTGYSKYEVGTNDVPTKILMKLNHTKDKNVKLFASFAISFTFLSFNFELFYIHTSILNIPLSSSFISPFSLLLSFVSISFPFTITFVTPVFFPFGFFTTIL